MKKIPTSRSCGGPDIAVSSRPHHSCLRARRPSEGSQRSPCCHAGCTSVVADSVAFFWSAGSHNLDTPEIHIYIYIHVCVYIYTHVCVYIYIYIYTCVYIYIYVCINTWLTCVYCTIINFMSLGAPKSDEHLKHFLYVCICWWFIVHNVIYTWVFNITKYLVPFALWPAFR